jgi:superfamily II DNA/RNA helicase
MTEQTQAPLFDAAGNPVAPEAPTPSDYVALATFDELPLSEGTRAAIAAKGYTKPTPVQAAALAPILAGKDVIVRSKTGTGKTAAFGIPIAEVVDPSLPKVQAVVLCNTRELALQVATELGELAAGRNVRVTAIYGGASMGAQQKALDDGAQVIVGTPGRVIDLLERKVLSFAAVKLAVLDEADEMLGVGFLEDVMTILAKCPRGHQTALFSATLTDQVNDLARLSLHEPKKVAVDAMYSLADHLVQEFIRIRPTREADREAIVLARDLVDGDFAIRQYLALAELQLHRADGDAGHHGDDFEHRFTTPVIGVGTGLGATRGLGQPIGSVTLGRRAFGTFIAALIGWFITW